MTFTIEKITDFKFGRRKWKEKQEVLAFLLFLGIEHHRTLTQMEKYMT